MCIYCAGHNSPLQHEQQYSLLAVVGDCLDLPLLKYGLLLFNGSDVSQSQPEYHQNDTVQYQCARGYVLWSESGASVSTSTTTCQRNGQWSLVNVTCRGKWYRTAQESALLRLHNYDPLQSCTVSGHEVKSACLCWTCIESQKLWFKCFWLVQTVLNVQECLDLRVMLLFTFQMQSSNATVPLLWRTQLPPQTQLNLVHWSLTTACLDTPSTGMVQPCAPCTHFNGSMCPNAKV